MRVTSLTGRPVVSLADARKLGNVSDVMIDLAGHRLAGIKVKAGLLEREQFIPAEEIASIGPDAITVRHPAEQAHGTPAGHPSVVDLGELKQVRVLTESGRLLGMIADVDLDEASLQARAYLLGQGLLASLRRERAPSVPVDLVKSHGPRLMIVAERVAEESVPGAEPAAETGAEPAAETGQAEQRRP